MSLCLLLSHDFWIVGIRTILSFISLASTTSASLGRYLLLIIRVLQELILHVLQLLSDLAWQALAKTESSSFVSLPQKVVKGWRVALITLQLLLPDLVHTLSRLLVLLVPPLLGVTRELLWKQVVKPLILVICVPSNLREVALLLLLLALLRLGRLSLHDVLQDLVLLLVSGRELLLRCLLDLFNLVLRFLGWVLVCRIFITLYLLYILSSLFILLLFLLLLQLLSLVLVWLGLVSFLLILQLLLLVFIISHILIDLGRFWNILRSKLIVALAWLGLFGLIWFIDLLHILRFRRVEDLQLLIKPVVVQLFLIHFIAVTLPRNLFAPTVSVENVPLIHAEQRNWVGFLLGLRFLFILLRVLILLL